MPLLPLTREGRQTLVYLTFAGAGPATSAVNLWAMLKAAADGQWQVFYPLAMTNAVGNGIIVTALAMFVSIRAIKISKDGFQADGEQGG